MHWILTENSQARPGPLLERAWESVVL